MKQNAKLYIQTNLDKMKKKCAVFTIVKNESYFLPIWIKHYKRYFNNSDIYVLDHQTNDGSTSNLDVNVVSVVNELAFDHRWLVEVVQSFQKDLLENYECVLFAESDEIIYSIDKALDESINDFINSDFNYIRFKVYEIIKDLQKEKILSIDESIIKNRNYWFDNWMYSKSLLSKVPLQWTWGFHNLASYPNDPTGTFGLTLCHLHRVDFELMLERHEERATKWKLKNDGPVAGYQHRIGDREGVLEYFNKVIVEGCVIEEIPLEHKNKLEI